MATDKTESWVRLGELIRSFTSTNYQEPAWRKVVFYISCVILVGLSVLGFVNVDWFPVVLMMIFLFIPLGYLSYRVCFKRSRRFKKQKRGVDVYENAIVYRYYSSTMTVWFSEVTELQIIRRFTTGGWTVEGQSASVNMRNAQGKDLLNLELSPDDMVWAKDIPNVIDDIFFQILLKRTNERGELHKLPVSNNLFIGSSFIEDTNGSKITLDEVKKVKKSSSNPYKVTVISNNPLTKPIVIDLSINERLTKAILSKFFPIFQK